MLALRLTPHQLRANDISDTVRHEHSRRHEALLAFPGNIARAERDDEADYGPKEPDQRVADDWRNRAVTPFRLPDDGEARDDGEAAEDKERDANVLEPRAEPPGERDADGTDEAEWELKQDAFERRVAKGGNNERTES